MTDEAQGFEAPELEAPAAPRRRQRRRPVGRGGLAIQIALLVVIAGLGYGAAFNAAQNLARANVASGFGFWNNTAGFDISQTLISYSAEYLELRPRLLGRASQYAPGRRDQHRARDRARLCDRHRAAVAQLFARAARRRLCRACSQRPAPAAIAVLVQCGIEIAARAARQFAAAGGQPAQQPRPVPAAAAIRARLPRRRHRAGGRHRCRARVARVRTPPARAIGRRAAGILAGARSSLRFAARRLRAGGIAGELQFPGHGPLQRPRRPRNSPRIRRAHRRAVALYRGLHRRSGARRRACRCRPARAKRPMRSACGRRRRCASSSFRRRCA